MRSLNADKNSFWMQNFRNKCNSDTNDITYVNSVKTGD
jgi:hypothetical protein